MTATSPEHAPATEGDDDGGAPGDRAHGAHSGDAHSGDAPGTGRRGQSSGRAAGLAMVGAGAATVANFGIALLVAGSSTTLAGLFFATTAVVTIAGNSSALGTMTGLTYFLPTALAAERPNPRAVLGLALGPVLAVSVGVAAALAGAAGPLAEVIAADNATEVAAMLRVLAVGVPAWALSTAVLGATRGLGSIVPTVAVNQVLRPLGQLALIGVVVLGAAEPSATSVAVAWLVPVLVGAVVAAVATVRFGGLRADGPAAVTRAEFWRYTRPRAMSAAGQIALERSDVILVSALAGEAAAGVYGTVTRFVTAGNFVVFAMGQALSAPLRRAIVAARWAEAQRLLDRATAWMALTAGSYFLLVAAKADAIVGVIGDDLQPGATALTVASAAMVVNAIAGPVDLTLLMLGHSRASLAATLAALAVNLAAAWILIPRFGLVGAAAAWGLAVAVQNGVAAAAVWRRSYLRPVGPSARRAAAVAAVATIPIGVFTPASFTGALLAGAGAGVVLAVLAAAQAPAFGLDVGPLRRAHGGPTDEGPRRSCGTGGSDRGRSVVVGGTQQPTEGLDTQR